MNDIYAEWLVKRKTQAYAPFIKIGAIFLILIGLLASALVWFGAIILLAAVGIAYVAFQMTKIEYEYIFVTNELTIDKILNQQRRKKAKAISMEKVEIIAPFEAHELDSYKNNPKFKVVDYSSGESKNKTYGVVCTDEKGSYIIVIEPNEKLLKAMKSSSPRKVVIQ